MASSSHHMIFLSVPPFDQYRLLMARYKNGAITRRVPWLICANCPPSKSAWSTGIFVCDKNVAARSAPMDEATTSARRVTPAMSRTSPPAESHPLCRHISALRSRRSRSAGCRNTSPANILRLARCSRPSRPLRGKRVRQVRPCCQMFQIACKSHLRVKTANHRLRQRLVKIFQWIKSVITPASTAAMTAIPSVPKSHFLRLTLLGI
mgnify:CR=1 FL=1